MMRQYELVDRVVSYDPHASEDLLNRAYVFATQKHGDQKRASGDPYFSHPVEVAGILTELRLDPASIATALLHDTIEDTDTTYGEIEKLFGREIADLVNGVTKLSQLELTSEGSAYAENFRKLLLATASDIRVLLVKFADRLHNMRTLHFVKSDEKRRRIAQETLDIYAPLAGRMGMQGFREELEDLAFGEINADARNLVLERLTLLKEENGVKLDAIAYEISAMLAEKGVKAQVYGREKKPFSIWRKSQNKSISLEQLSDVFGYRVIAEDEDSCYRALGILHREYRYVPGRYKDYISTPKLNGYRSLHTTVIGPDRQRVEVQIRTRQMHDFAENGVAAHWGYKDLDTNAPETDIIKPFAWLKDMVEQIQTGETAEEFLENTKLELFTDQVFCFTPKGRLIALPRGATALDFAYAVHTEIGNSCVGVRINGLKLPFRTLLKNGDEIEIIRDPGHLPSENWLHYVSTGKARAAIRQTLRDKQTGAYADLGQKMLDTLFENEELKGGADVYERALGTMGFATLTDLYIAVGRGEMPAAEVLAAIMPEWQQNKGGRFAGAMRNLLSRRSKGLDPKTAAVPLNGERVGQAVKIADNCFPLPGDEIIGILSTGKGVVIYPSGASALDQYVDAPERWVAMRWQDDDQSGAVYDSRLKMTIVNRTGALNTITQTIADFDSNISNLALTQRDEDFCNLTLDIEVRDAAHARQIVDALSGISVISKVQRIISDDAPSINEDL